MLGVALAAGSVLRLVGLAFGLPQRVHPDEWAIVENAIDLAARHSFEPAIFNRPDHLEIKVDYLVFQVYSYLVHGAPADVSFASDPNRFYFIARLVTALCGIAMIVMAFVIGRRFGRSVGVVAAVLTALWPPFVQDSHYATPDIPLTLVLMVFVYLSIRYVEAPSRGWLVGASAVVGAATTIKYTGLVAALMIAACVILAALRDRRPWRIVTHGTLATVALVGAVFVISPVLFTNYPAVHHALTVESRTTHPGADGLGLGGNAHFYVEQLVNASGILLVVAVVTGGVWTILDRRLAALPLWLGVVYLGATSAVALHWPRWAMPMYISAVFLAAVGICRSYVWAQQRRPRATAVVATVVLGLSLVNITVSAVSATVSLALPDTRNVARPALAARGITPANTLYEGYSPFQAAPGYIFDRLEVTGDGSVALRDVPGTGIVDYVMISSGIFNRYLAGAQYSAEQEVYAALARQPLVLSFEPTAAPQPTRWELSNIRNRVEYLRRAADGGMTGPVLRVFEAPEVAP